MTTSNDYFTEKKMYTKRFAFERQIYEKTNLALDKI